ncbi:MAG: hypothetical protein ACXWVT_06990 [Burkholderiaceae bacterium]
MTPLLGMSGDEAETHSGGDHGRGAAKGAELPFIMAASRPT